MTEPPDIAQLDLQDFEWNVQIRPLRIGDFDDLIRMQERCFPGMSPWGRDQIESQIAIFPEGQIVIEIDGKLAASSSSLIMQYESGTPCTTGNRLPTVATSGITTGKVRRCTASRLWSIPNTQV